MGLRRALQVCILYLNWNLKMGNLGKRKGHKSRFYFSSKKQKIISISPWGAASRYCCLLFTQCVLFSQQTEGNMFYLVPKEPRPIWFNWCSPFPVELNQSSVATSTKLTGHSSTEIRIDIVNLASKRE